MEYEDALSKLMRYCAYQERCRQEIRRKIYDWEISKEEVQELIEHLEEEGFLDEDRFARAFAGGKFRVKRWGRNKIRIELRKKGLDEATIEAGIRAEIPEDDYETTLNYLVEKKASELSNASARDRSLKVTRFLQQRGFEWDLIMDKVKEL